MSLAGVATLCSVITMSIQKGQLWAWLVPCKMTKDHGRGKLQIPQHHKQHFSSHDEAFFFCVVVSLFATVKKTFLAPHTPTRKTAMSKAHRGRRDDSANWAEAAQFGSLLTHAHTEDKGKRDRATLNGTERNTHTCLPHTN